LLLIMSLSSPLLSSPLLSSPLLSSSPHPTPSSRMKLDVGKVLQAGVLDNVSWEKRK
jgi:hypothetical protein